VHLVISRVEERHDANDEAMIRDNSDWWWWRDRIAMFGRRANTLLIIAKTDRQNSLPIIPESGIIGN
jgi:hypothetical protein